ncbi:MAG TPA: NADH-quinone oxidoreductase subunit M [Gemmatimonadaceae bacterium]|nr:NADH-quinone oxidoreductase subunit M [Gemmatimonadaceae bacterium]
MEAFLASIHYNSWILPVLLLLPIAGATVVLAHGWLTQGNSGALPPSSSARVRQIALLLFTAEAVLSLGLWWSVDPSATNWQAFVDFPWIPMWGARITLGVDGIAMLLILLTTLLMPLAVLGGWTSIRENLHSYYALLLVLTTGMIGVFMSLDLLLFFAMWELMLVPMYLIIGVWGGQRRLYASLKFFLYTMLGSMVMLVAIVYLAMQTPDGLGRPVFSYDYILANATLSPTAALWLFGAFFLAFAVKVPMWPLHTWLPDAHVEAPTAGSVILAAIMLKMGTFGFVRFALPLFPSAATNETVRVVVLTLAVIGIVYGALVAMVQPDFKKLVAYSSVSHLGFVMLGIFALNLQSVQGALMVNLSHGVSTGALFLLVGMMYERRHSRLIEDYGGIARVMPAFAVALSIVAMSSIGVPGTNGFVGEFLVLIGSFRTRPLFAVIAATAVIFAAAYLLWALQRIIYNPLDKPENRQLRDLNWREIGLLVPLVFAIFWMGIYPKPILDKTRTAATRLVERVEAMKVNQPVAQGR